MSEVMLQGVRIAFCQNLFRAGSFKPEQAPKYQAAFIFEPKGENHKALHKALVAAAEAKWPGKGEAMCKQLKAAGKVCVRDGAEKANYDGFEDMMFVSTSSKKRPNVFDRDRSALTEEDGRVYAGAYVNAKIAMWGQDNEWGKRLNAELLGVQFSRDGEPFGGGAPPATADDFPELEDETEADAAGDWADDSPF